MGLSECYRATFPWENSAKSESWMTEASMISRDCNLEHLANSFNMARVHISSFNEVIVLCGDNCLQ